MADLLCSHILFAFRKPSSCAKPLEGMTILDVGCGGGLSCEVIVAVFIESVLVSCGVLSCSYIHSFDVAFLMIVSAFGKVGGSCGGDRCS